MAQGDWRRFVFRDRGRGKFWCVRQTPDGFDVWFGALGAKKGQVKSTALPAGKIEGQIAKLISAKQRSGYVEVGEHVVSGEPRPKAVANARQRAADDIDPRYAGHRALQQAIYHEKEDRVRELLFGEGVRPDVAVPPSSRDQAGYVFFTAVAVGSPAMVAAFLDAGMDPNTRNLDGDLALPLSAMNHPRMTSLLLERGADPNVRDGNGTPALHLCAEGYWTQKTAALLLAHGADVTAVDARGRTALHRLIESFHGDIALARRLVEAGTPLDHRDDLNRTPHDVAIELRRTELSKLIEDAGGARSDRDAGEVELVELVHRLARMGRRPEGPQTMGDAVGAEGLETLEAFLADGQDPDAPRRDGWYPIQLAKTHGRDDIVERLIEHGARDRPQRIYRDPYAVAERQISGALVDAAAAAQREPDDPRQRPVRDPEERRRLACRIAELLRGGVLDGRLETFRTQHVPLLSFAAENGFLELAETLLELGVDPNGPDYASLDPAKRYPGWDRQGPHERPAGAGTSPLARAVYGGWSDVARLLLACGADPSFSHSDLDSPLTEAASNGDLEMVETLLDAGADPTWVGAGSQTAINQASGPRKRAIRRLVLERARPALEALSVSAVSVRRSRKRPLRDPTTDAVRQEDLDGHPLLLAVDAPISDVTEAAVAVRPGARVQRDVARQTVVSALDAFFVFQFRGRGDAWFVPVGWLGERTWRPFAIDLAHAVGRPVFALTAYDDPPTLAELPSGVVHTGMPAVTKDLGRLGYWCPLVGTEGHGDFYDHGFHARLVVRDVSKKDISRVDFIALD